MPSLVTGYSFATYGDGADAFLFKVTDQIEKIRDRRGIKRHVASKMMLPNYGKYVEIRELMEWESPRRGARRSSLPVLWRERKMIFGLYGQKCRKCGNIQYPRQRICIYCQAKDDFDPIRLSDKTGKVFTFSMDQRAQEIVLPEGVYGGRPGRRRPVLQRDDRPRYHQDLGGDAGRDDFQDSDGSFRESSSGGFGAVQLLLAGSPSQVLRRDYDGELEGQSCYSRHGVHPVR